MGMDKRKHPRIDFHLDVTIRGHEGIVEVRDFSLGGLFVHVGDASGFKEGNVIWLVMKLPHEKNPLRVKAQIMRVIKDAIAVEFVDLLPQDAMTLEYCFHIFKDTVPMPGS